MDINIYYFQLRRTVLFDNFGAVPVPTKKRRCEPVVVNNVEMSSKDIVGIEMYSSDVAGVVMDSSDVVGVETVSYTHLTLPTKLEV